MNETWTQFMAARLKNKEEGFPWWINDKSKLNSFLCENEIPSPVVFREWDNPQELDLSGLPERFVVKPNMMSSAAGVMILHSVGSDQFYDSMSNKTLSKQDVIDIQSSLYERSSYKKSYKLMVEELIVDARVLDQIPIDYKVYCFYDKPVLIQQIDRNVERTGTTFFDGQFQPLELSGRIESSWKHYQTVEPIRPGTADEMLRLSTEVTMALKIPFVRVDFYNSTRGALVGELTPTPGGPYFGKLYKFTDEYDAQLGREWKNAIERIQNDTLR